MRVSSLAIASPRRLTVRLDHCSEDVLAFIAERDDDKHLRKVRKSGAGHAAAEVSTRAQDESALFEDDDDEEATEEIVVKGAGEQKPAAVESVQQAKSAARETPAFEGLRTLSSGSHKIQDIKELMRVPVRLEAGRFRCLYASQALTLSARHARSSSRPTSRRARPSSRSLPSIRTARPRPRPPPPEAAPLVPLRPKLVSLSRTCSHDLSVFIRLARNPSNRPRPPAR